METHFAGKAVAVTGGAGGIGREIVTQFAARGAAVAFVDIGEEAGLRLRDELRAAGHTAGFVAADLSRAQDCEAAVDAAAAALGALDIWINCAGLGRGAPPEALPLEDWDYVLNVNLRAAFLCARRATPHLRARGGGSIVNIASTRALMSEPHTEAYAASKGGLVALTHALAASLAPDRIRVNAVSPGWICTGGYERLTAADHSQHLSGRVGRPSDIARACLYLCEDGNEFVNGQNLVIDGGMTKKMIYVE